MGAFGRQQSRQLRFKYPRLYPSHALTSVDLLPGHAYEYRVTQSLNQRYCAWRISSATASYFRVRRPASYAWLSLRSAQNQLIFNLIFSGHESPVYASRPPLQDACPGGSAGAGLREIVGKRLPIWYGRFPAFGVLYLSHVQSIQVTLFLLVNARAPCHIFRVLRF